ncbi:hypothetical protein JIG36_33200 [Actinoplanes sp. LDG1-06]|uniref:Phenylalanine--tRNA ligase n=1 Tax=Paractinoplanes ovalisporus TaxID=2810368 RepID=A0ABS2AKN6_9ACTN|nr:hypothetical protein [Actinoplanes ovalisporus]MBM2620380.1 hypothetical protein [Actinoplanes ovalisporus]
MPASPEVATTLEAVRSAYRSALGALRDCPGPELTGWHRDHLGRRSALAALRSRVGALPAEDRAAAGRAVRQAADDLATALADRREQTAAGDPAPADRVRLDPTHIPDTPPPGGRHPVSLILDEAAAHFAALGFVFRDAPQIEDEAHCFDLLGVPADHPTRSPAHTFYAEGAAVLRSHTTASVLRVLRTEPAGPASRFVVAGPCHRNNVPNARFVHQFHQLEAVAAGPSVRMSDIKGLATGFVDAVLGDGFDPRLRFRRFPYVSPGLAVDVECAPCGAEGCGLCQGSGRLEIMSGGLLAAGVLRAAGWPEDLPVAALAISLERLLAVRHGLGDIRHFLRNDLRLLAQAR